MCATCFSGTLNEHCAQNRVLYSQLRNSLMFVSWSVYPKGQQFDAEYFTSEDHAVDVAYSWSAEDHGKAMIVARNDMEWMEVSC